MKKSSLYVLIAIFFYIFHIALDYFRIGSDDMALSIGLTFFIIYFVESHFENDEVVEVEVEG